jgi:Caspase domain
MFTNDGYALLIGVDDYSTFDKSSGQPVGTHDLYGSRNDVRTFWRLCRLVGIKPANIRVLASPPFAPGELEGASPENVGPATEAEILAKTGWLAEKLAQTEKPTGILTYSGHGDWLGGQGLVLCPSDVTSGGAGQPELEHAVPFRALNERLAAHSENLTVVLDTCHSGADARPGKVGKPLTLTRRKLATGHAPELEELAGRVLAAARRNQVAYQSLFDGQYRGVFSWAISAAIEQWRATQQGAGNVLVDMSYAKLVETTERLMSALWFEQTPQLLGRAGIEKLAVLQHGVVAEPGETTRRPDRVAMPRQLDPGFLGYTVYALNNSAGGLMGQVLVTNTANGAFAAQTEYWYMYENLSNTAPFTINGGTSQPWTNPPTGLGTLSFATTATPTWSSGAVTGSLPCFSNTRSLDFYAINWQMSNSGGTWTGSITWWHSSATNLLGPSQSITFTPNRTSGTHYYYVATPL